MAAGRWIGVENILWLIQNAMDDRGIASTGLAQTEDTGARVILCSTRPRSLGPRVSAEVGSRVKAPQFEPPESWYRTSNHKGGLGLTSLFVRPIEKSRPRPGLRPRGFTTRRPVTIQMLMASSTMARPYKGSSNLREIRARENRTRYRSDWKSHVHTMQYAGQ
ncbi:hypothetical protein J6590_094824 [Homalodisca vitripennis]|nr:hypothetical protein J6590_094824 [Homalodisca vitripennis]